MRIAIIEDNDGYIEDLEVFLNSRGHKIVLVCRTIDETKEALRCSDDGRLQSGIEFDVAIVDGNLGPTAAFGADGELTCSLLNVLLPHPTIVGFSGGNNVYGADRQSRKNMFKLKTIFDELENRA